MATVDMNSVQFYHPPNLNPLIRPKYSAMRSLTQRAPHSNADQILESYGRLEAGIALVLDQRDDFGSPFQTGRDSAVRAQEDEADSYHDPTKGYSEVDDDFPTVEELCRTSQPTDASTTQPSKSERALQHLDKAAPDASGTTLDQIQSNLRERQGDSRGSRDLPIILEDDDETDSMDDEVEVAATSNDVHAGRADRGASLRSTHPTQDPTSELSKASDLFSFEKWYDLEDHCYVYKELPPSPGLGEQGRLMSTLARDHTHSLHHSSGPSQDQMNQHDDDKITRSTSEAASHSLPDPLDEDGEGWSDDIVPELEKDQRLALEDQEKSSSASAPSSPRPPRRSTEPSYPQINLEHNQGGTRYGRLGERKFGSPLCNHDQGQKKSQEQQLQEVAGGATRKDDNNDHVGEREKQREKRRHQDEVEEISSDIHNSKSSIHSHDTNDEDDKDLRLAKRRKLSLVPMPSCFGRPDSLTPSSPTQLEMDNAQSQVEQEYPPILVDYEYHHTSQTSRSPSATIESVPIAEHQEWPFQGFLKCTRIGNDTTYNLEFKLPCISGPLDLPIDPEILAMDSSSETLPEAANPHKVVAHSKVHSTALRTQIKRQRWTPEEDATVLKMKGDGCSWEEIHAALPHRSKETIQVRYSTKLKK